MNAINKTTEKGWQMNVSNTTAGFERRRVVLSTLWIFALLNYTYAEIYMTPTYWPDFRKEAYVEALIEYQKRERRFGATGDQVARSREERED